MLTLSKTLQTYYFQASFRHNFTPLLFTFDIPSHPLSSANYHKMPSEVLTKYIMTEKLKGGHSKTWLCGLLQLSCPILTSATVNRSYASPYTNKNTKSLQFLHDFSFIRR